MRLPVLPLALTIAIAAFATGIASAQTNTNSTKQNPNAPVTDASAKPNQNPLGAPVRPLTNLPSLTLAGVNGNDEPGEAFFEKAGNGTAVRVLSRAVQPGVQLSADLARGTCPNGQTVYKLNPLHGNDSITTLPNVPLEKLESSHLAVRVLKDGKVIECGVIGSQGEMKTKS